MELLAPGHLLVVLAVVLLMFGGKKLPELASGLGKGIKEFRKAASELDGEDEVTRPSTPSQQ